MGNIRPVLFASERDLDRAENIRTVYEAYDGEKEFLKVHSEIKSSAIKGRYSVMVTDEFPIISPGRVIMIGHGIDGAKLYGFDQPHPYITSRTTKMMDYYVTGGQGTVQMVAHCSGLPVSAALPLGVPRTDEYIGKKKGDGGTILAQYRAYLYVPTYRNRGETTLPDIDWGLIDECLNDDELFVIKSHPMTKNKKRVAYKHIIEVESSMPSAKYLIDCDTLITDYSSILFDGYLLKKPCVLFEKEQGYVHTRGMYFKYPDRYSSRYCSNEYDLIAMLRKSDGLTEVENKIIRQVADKCDGHATERVCRLIKEVVEGRR